MKAATFLALGDSYTIGEGVEEEGRWPMQVAARLREQGIAVNTPRIVATTGWTTDELAAAMDNAELAPHYDLVTLLIGVNNQYRGRDLEEYREQFRDLLDRAIALAGGDPSHVVVVSIPDWGVTTFAEGRDRDAIAREIGAFNAVARAEIPQAARWVDVTGLSREAGAKPGMLVDDGLHPSATQYATWVTAILPEARAALM